SQRFEVGRLKREPTANQGYADHVAPVLGLEGDRLACQGPVVATPACCWAGDSSEYCSRGPALFGEHGEGVDRREPANWLAQHEGLAKRSRPHHDHVPFDLYAVPLEGRGVRRAPILIGEDPREGAVAHRLEVGLEGGLDHLGEDVGGDGVEIRPRTWCTGGELEGPSI